MRHLKHYGRRLLKGRAGDWVIVAAGAVLGLIVFLLVQMFAGPASPPERKPVASVPRQEAPVHKAPTVVARPEKRRAAPPSAEEAARPQPRAVPAWQRNAVVHPPVANHPMIAVIIDDMGIDRKRSAEAIRLTGPLTMSFLTYAKHLQSQADAARKAGHELMVHVPMEPEGDVADPGPNVIANDESPDEVMHRLDWALSRFTGYVGINNHMGSRFTADEAGMTLVLKELKRRGLLFVDSRTTPKTVARRLARKLSVPFAERNVFLDDDPRPAVIQHQLDEVVRIARERKYAVAIGHPRDTTLAALRKWLSTLRLRGLMLVPVSAVVQYRMESG